MLKKLLNKKLVQVALGILAVGFVLSNFWSILWWAILGGIAVIGGLIVYSMYEVQKEKMAKSEG